MHTRTGPTPGGGDSSSVTYYDSAGREVPGPDGAATAEAVEYLEGTPIARHYLERAEPVPTHADPGDAVSEPDMAESVKQTWDVYVNDSGQYRLVETVPDLLAATGHDRQPLADQRAHVANLMTLPSWEAAPDGLKTAAEAWLEETRPA